MDFKIQEIHFDKFVKKMKSVMLSKGNDYSEGDSDRLSNFKRAGEICQLTPEQNCLSLIATKVARLGVLLKNEASPENESVQDSVLDLANYAVLLSMLIHDKRVSMKSEQLKSLDYMEYFDKSWGLSTTCKNLNDIG